MGHQTAKKYCNSTSCNLTKQAASLKFICVSWSLHSIADIGVPAVLKWMFQMHFYDHVYKYFWSTSSSSNVFWDLSNWILFWFALLIILFLFLDFNTGVTLLMSILPSLLNPYICVELDGLLNYYCFHCHKIFIIVKRVKAWNPTASRI